MSYTLTLGVYSKKLNSTAQPVPDSTWDIYTVTLKEETSIDEPVLLLSASFSTVRDYNYALFQGRYYWVSDVVAVRTNVVEVSLTLDYMATYKTQIMATSAFIEYGLNDMSAFPSYRLEDQRRPIAKTPGIAVEDKDISDGIIDATSGTYIIQVVGNDPSPVINTHKGLMAFALDAARLNKLTSSISPSLGSDIASILASGGSPAEILNELTGYGLQQRLLVDSAFSAIQSVIWVPFSLGKLAGASWTIYCGNYNTGVTGIVLNAHAPKVVTTTIPIPWPVNDWRRCLCQLLLYLPCIGTVPIPIDQVIDAASLSITWSAEYVTGSISVRVDADNYICFTGSTSVAAPYGVGRSAVSAMDTISGSIQQTGGIIRAGLGVLDIGAAIASTALGIGSGISGAVNQITGGIMDQLHGMAQQVQPTISSVGALGGVSAIGQSTEARLVRLYYPNVGDAAFTTIYGHPVMHVYTPVAGFCKTRGFSIAIPGHAKHAALINATMDGGAFIE